MKLITLILLSGTLNFSTAPIPLVTGIAVGAEAPEIAMKNLKGQELKLSSLRGNIVLVDFWASWCKPCRAKHPGLIRVYNEYHDASFASADGFEIYSVSLDKSKEAWIKALVADGITWPHHVSDLKGWDSKAVKLYGITGIPANILLDENGVILGGAMSEAQLKETLTSLK
ncbi:TlpA family protein disulfide reductase [Crocinitomix catalasitica]|nr:TlpA family protein disulfide reductase [Crocinitomix catalasitica]